MKTLIILGALAAIATPAAAQDRGFFGDRVVLQITVSFSDLDLSRVSGADTVIKRLRKAARQVCGDVPNPADMEPYRRHRACVRQTMDAAVKQVNAPLVTARYAHAATQLAGK